MNSRPRPRAIADLALVIFLLAPAPAPAADPATDASPSTPRFALKASSIDATPQPSGRYTLRARFAPTESAGELREGANLTLIGRFAKGGVDCGTGGVIFSNGFEGN